MFPVLLFFLVDGCLFNGLCAVWEKQLGSLRKFVFEKLAPLMAYLVEDSLFLSQNHTKSKESTFEAQSLIFKDIRNLKLKPKAQTSRFNVPSSKMKNRGSNARSPKSEIQSPQCDVWSQNVLLNKLILKTISDFQLLLVKSRCHRLKLKEIQKV